MRRTFSARGPFGPWPTSNSTAITLSQVLEPFTIDGAPVEEVVLPGFVLDESEPVVQTRNVLPSFPVIVPQRRISGSPYLVSLRLPSS